MIPTFIYDPAEGDGESIVLTGSEAHHVAAVLRMNRGETIRAIDGRGTAHVCEIKETGSKRVLCSIISSSRNSGEPTLDLTLAIGVSAGLKFDLVVEKGTEVGVGRFVPLVTSKGKIKRVDLESWRKRETRWRRIAEAAAKQSGRSVVPTVESPQAVEAFVGTCPPDEGLMFHPGGTPCRLENRLETLPQNNLTLLVGPESGFSPEEVALAEARAIPVISLGDRVLRTETAGIVLSALAIYSYQTVNSRP